jgi:hypothetical protein
MTDDLNAPYDPGAEIARLKQEVHVASRISELVNDELVAATLNGMLHGLQNDWIAERNPA